MITHVYMYLDYINLCKPVLFIHMQMSVSNMQLMYTIPNDAWQAVCNQIKQT